MKIAHLFISFPNSYQKYNSRLIERLQNNQLENIIFTFQKKQNDFKEIEIIELKQSKVEKLVTVFSKFLVYLSFKKNYKYSYSKAFIVFSKYNKLSNTNFDILHIHHAQTLSQDFLNYIDFFKIKALVTFRGSDILIRPYRSKAEFDFVNNIFKYIKYAHTVSDNIKDELKKYVVSQHNIFSIKRTPETFFKIKHQKTNLFHVTSIGRIHWTKGYIPTLIALSEIIKKGSIDFIYNICGSGDQGYLDEINCWIRNLDLEKNVVLHGYLNDTEINQVLSTTNLYLQPSISEGIPNTILRVLQNEIPILASNVGGISEVLNEENGLFFNYSDFEDFKNKLAEFINGKLDATNFKFDDLIISEELEINSYKNMYSIIYIQSS